VRRAGGDAYHVPSEAVLAILDAESGQVGLIRRNVDGSYDIGPMQINSRWLGELKRYGITAAHLRDYGCLNVHVGSWILSREQARAGNIWVAIGRYHSWRPSLASDYIQRVATRVRWLRRDPNYSSRVIANANREGGG